MKIRMDGLLPKKHRDNDTYRQRQMNVEEFVKIFGIQPDFKNLRPDCPFYKGDVLTIPQALERLEKAGIIASGFMSKLWGVLIIKFGHFKHSYYAGYEFSNKDVPFGEDKVYLKWTTDGWV